MARRKSRGEQGANFRGEDERVAVVIVIKRLDPQTITNESQGASPGVPESEREHPPPIRDRITAPRAEAFQQNLGVTFGPKSHPTGGEFSTEVTEVEDLAVVSDPIARHLVEHRLMPGRRK